MAPGEPFGDQELLQRAAGGDRRAFTELIERHRAMLWSTAVSILGDDRLEAEDVLQNALLRAVRHAASFDGRGPVAAWLRRLVSNEALRLLKQRRGLPVPAGDEASLVQLEARSTTSLARVGPEVDPGEGIATKLLLDNALRALPPKFAEAFVLFAVRELSVADVALVQDASVGTVKSRLHRARTLLKQTIDSSDLTGNR